MGIRTSLEKLLSDCHELELAFSEVNLARRSFAVLNYRDGRFLRRKFCWDWSDGVTSSGESP